MKRQAESIPIWVAVVAVLFVCGAVTLLALSGRSATAQQKPPTPKPVIEKRARDILREMGDYLKTAPAFIFKTTITYDQVLPTGQKLQFGAVTDVAVRRPNRLRAGRRGDLENRQLWYDGKSITLLDVNENVYATIAAPGVIDAALDLAMKKYGISAPLADVVYADPYTLLMEKVEGATYVGLHSVGGTRCHHLAFTQKNVDWQIWIEDGKQLVPRKVVITYKNDPGSPQFTAVISKWDFNVRLPDRLFIFHPPEGAGRVTIEEGK